MSVDIYDAMKLDVMSDLMVPNRDRNSECSINVDQFTLCSENIPIARVCCICLMRILYITSGFLLLV